MQNDDWNRTTSVIRFLSGDFSLLQKTATTFYTQGILTENGRGIEKIKIDTLCNHKEYLEQKIELREIIFKNEKITEK